MGAGPSCRESGRSLVPRKGDIFCHPGGRNVAPEARNSTASGGCGRLFMPGGHNIAPEARNSFPDSPEVPFFAVTPQLSLRGHTFFCLARKKYAKKRRWMRSIALTRRKANRSVVRFFRYTVRSPNALRAAHLISYTEISHCGKYLTYGSRAMFVLLRE